MNDDRGDSVARLLRLFADRLEGFVDGDPRALDHLGEALEDQGFTAEDVQDAVLVLRGMTGGLSGPARAAVDRAPGKDALRVPSAEERDTLSPEAWGYLLELRRSGSLDAGQFERVLDVLTGWGVRPVDVELAQEVAARVALHGEVDPDLGDPTHGEIEPLH